MEVYTNISFSTLYFKQYKVIKTVKTCILCQMSYCECKTHMTTCGAPVITIADFPVAMQSIEISIEINLQR